MGQGLFAQSVFHVIRGRRRKKFGGKINLIVKKTKEFYKPAYMQIIGNILFLPTHKQTHRSFR